MEPVAKIRELAKLVKILKKTTKVTKLTSRNSLTILMKSSVISIKSKLTKVKLPT